MGVAGGDSGLYTLVMVPLCVCVCVCVCVLGGRHHIIEEGLHGSSSQLAKRGGSCVVSAA